VFPGFPLGNQFLGVIAFHTLAPCGQKFLNIFHIKCPYFEAMFPDYRYESVFLGLLALQDPGRKTKSTLFNQSAPPRTYFCMSDIVVREVRTTVV